MNKILLICSIIMIGVTNVNAAYIEVHNADTIWESDVTTISQTFLVKDRIVINNADIMFNSILAPMQTAASITVNSPNGGENWQTGTTKSITWSNIGTTGSFVKIDLYKGGIFKQTIISSTPNGGSYSWNIPTTQTLGNDYKIKIISTNLGYTDTSDNYFSITGTTVELLKNPGFEESLRTIPKYWNKQQTGTKAIFTYPETGRVGGKSVAIKYPTKETGKVALWTQSMIPIEASKQYKLSGYMKLQGVTGGGSLPRYNGASLRVNWYKADGGLIKVDVINKIGTIGWTKYEKIFTAPPNAVKTTVGGDLFNSAGKVWFDDLSFIKIY